MMVHIDQEGCIECGGCESVCSEIFELKDGEKASIVIGFRIGEPGDGEVKDNYISCVEEAIEVCPVDVISIE